jgi:effector-binding domain-containing protein
MIVKIGVKTLTPELVAYYELKPGEKEVETLALLNAEAHEKGARPKDPTIIVYKDPKGTKGCRIEVQVPIDKEVPGLNTKVLPEMRAGFIVFSGTRYPIEHYYEELRKYIKERGLTPTSNSLCSMEAVYQPDTYGLSTGSFIDEDAQEHWTTEILIPIEG